MKTKLRDKLIEKANDHADRGEHHEAIALLESLGGKGPNWVGLNLGNSYSAVGDVAAAQKAFEQSWIAGCDDAGFNLAELYRDVGKVSRARTIYRRLIQKSYVKAMVQEAEELREEGDVPAAQALLACALKHEGPTGDYAAGLLGYLLWSSTHSVTAEPLLRRGQHAYPTARTCLAKVVMKLGRLSEAIAILEEGVSQGEQESMLPLGNIWRDLGNEDAAESLYRQSYAVGDAHSAGNLGLLRWDQGRMKSARKWLKRAVKAGDKKAQAWLDELK